MTVVADASRSQALTALRLEIEDFLYFETELLDERKFDEWLDLFSDDFKYRVPLVRNLAAPGISGEYLMNPLDVSWFDEDKETLATRIAQIQTGAHWAEEPLSRTTHLLTNIRVVSATPSPEDASEVEVKCKFLTNRNRNADQDDILVGRRVDFLRRNEKTWSIAHRTIYLNQSVVLANNLSFFL